ncbi:hypothetical protein QJS10_CPB12g01168 [Acorus calamus]|uniref:50S ribosomal protein L32, chloroplastic n=1 Tax=Acorus calamus TaxID=4465 RepID=A0AAV9DK63_ACOCL|nr:hypothetical protein QJS10_CPB12g01168 [Acorus calamus]
MATAMAMAMALRSASNVGSIRRVGWMWFSSSASPSPLEGLSLIGSPPSLGAPRPVLPESDPGFTFFRGSMELMAVPKTKISPHKRRLRNGPKALKPVPVIIRCK